MTYALWAWGEDGRDEVPYEAVSEGSSMADATRCWGRMRDVSNGSFAVTFMKPKGLVSFSPGLAQPWDRRMT